MTFCPVPAFKKRGTFYSESDFNENTFTIDEMFDEKTVKTLKNESLFELNEVRSTVYGRCFTVVVKPQYQDVMFFLGLNALWDVSVFLHLKVTIFKKEDR